MNSSPEINAVPLPPVPKTQAGPPIRLARLLVSLILVIAVFDLCFWDIGTWPGASVSVFVLALSGIMLVNRHVLFAKSTTALLLALLVGASLAALIETGITNTLVLLMLVTALAGDSFFTDIASMWGRWLSQVVALVLAPGRVFWLGARLMETTLGGGIGGVVGWVLLTLPALVLLLIFGSLLASGNAVFGSWSDSFFNWLWKELALYLDAGRIALWCVIAVAALPLLRPANIPAWCWKWTEHLPQLPEVIPTRAAWFSSTLILVALNLLFLVSNIADALFLWGGEQLPSSVVYKTYVHEGVNTLIFTVILSAIVLIAIFQQSFNVVKGRGLKVLACLWIVQNLFLIFSVSDKIRIYIINYEMTGERLSVIIFLILVSIGFILLTLKIIQDRSVSWLIGGCVLATFATFYVTQFLDLGGWSADYNATQMMQHPGYRYDAATMSRWGAETWPALRRAHDFAPNDPDINQAWRQVPEGDDYKLTSGLDWKHWREFSLLAWMNRSAFDDKK